MIKRANMKMLGFFILLACNVVAHGSINCDWSKLPKHCILSEDNLVHCTTCSNTENMIHELPSCIRRLSICQKHPLDMVNVSFSRLMHLEGLVIDTQPCDGTRFVLGVNVPNLETGVKVPSVSPFPGLAKLRILRLKALIPSMHRADLFTGLSSLQILDVTRITKYDLKRLTSQLQKLVSVSSPVQKLIMKNAQCHSGYYIIDETVDIFDIICPFGKTIEHVDLSFNSIVKIKYQEGITSCALHLKYLDLSHNQIAHWIGDSFPMMNLLYMLDTFDYSHQFVDGNPIWGEHVMEGDDTTGLDDLMDPKDLKNSQNQELFTNHLESVIQWNIAAAHRYAGDIKVQDCASKRHTMNDSIEEEHIQRNSILDDHFTLCTFWECTLPQSANFSLSLCMENTLGYLIDTMDANRCIESCYLGVDIPLPPNMKTLLLGRITSGLHAGLTSIELSVIARAVTHGGCFGSNKLEHLDLSYSNHLLMTFVTKHIAFNGLDHLKYLSFFASQFQFGSLDFLVALSRLEYLDLGGNIILPESLEAALLNKTTLNYLGLADCRLHHLKPGLFNNLAGLNTLDLSHNPFTATEIESLTLNPQLQVLLVHNISLQLVPEGLRLTLDNAAKNLRVDLRDNPLVCDCTDVEWIDWFKNTKVNITDADNIMCFTQGKYQTVQSVDLYNLKWECDPISKILVGVCIFFAGILIAVVVYVIYIYRWHIYYYIYKLIEKFHRDNSGNPISYRFDALIVHSGEDRDRLWVHYVLRYALERNYGFKLCLPFRDFMPGAARMECVESGIRNSRKVIMIVSPNFVADQWCSADLNASHCVDVHKIILVRLEDVSQCDTEALLRQLLTYRPNFQWSEENSRAQSIFWRKLVRAMYDNR